MATVSGSRRRLSTRASAIVVTPQSRSRHGDVRIGLVVLAFVALSLLVPQVGDAATPPSTAPGVTVAIGSPSAVAVPSTVLNPKHQPNDSLDVIPAGNQYTSTSLQAATTATGPWMVVWPTGTTSMAVGASPFPGSNEITNNNGPVIPSSFTWDNGGGWVNSVYRLGGNSLVAFFHAEHHYG